jgi:hypothetical protein
MWSVCRGIKTMRLLVSLLAWLAMRAGARVRAARQSGNRALAAVIPGAAVLGQGVGADRAGRLVPLPEDTIEPNRSLGAHWALLAAVALIVLILGAGYLRRRWKAGWRPRPEWLAWGRGDKGK